MRIITVIPQWFWGIKKNESCNTNGIITFVLFWSEWRDLNPRHPAPKAGALPTALHPVIQLFIRLGVFSQTRRDNSFATPGDLRAASGRTLPAYCTVLSSAAQGGNETFSARDHPQARDVRSGRDGRILRIAPSCQVSCAENADRGDRPFPQGLAQAAFSVSWRQTFTPAMAKAKTNQKMHMTRG